MAPLCMYTTKNMDSDWGVLVLGSLHRLIMDQRTVMWVLPCMQMRLMETVLKTAAFGIGNMVVGLTQG